MILTRKNENINVPAGSRITETVADDVHTLSVSYNDVVDMLEAGVIPILVYEEDGITSWVPVVWYGIENDNYEINVKDVTYISSDPDAKLTYTEG